MYVIEPRSLANNCKKTIYDTVTCVRNNYSYKVSGLKKLLSGGKSGTVSIIEKPYIPNQQVNHDNVNARDENYNSVGDYIRNVYVKSEGIASIYKVPLKSVIDMSDNFIPYWMASDRRINHNASFPLGFEFPTDVEQITMPSVSTQFDPLQAKTRD